ncbi:MotA/TolQ/ExbB proton channel family protein [Erythrobacter sp. LQ02-29]|uniref:MotA/TolQ/ExbB proton channel family protein n=1 Tax=Erythrobacter sp. LQ02-29 TaxID=2920384 RepID=UPI001F4ECCAE|nr:MotA/TolQ/ExbB proton channel family protein [Erythrobacter sp. LQ02-29]MCP9221231.1 MotA/TolQ/ExbB proton channel family protein [Erythrobacter sp. LQ02-29]
MDFANLIDPTGAAIVLGGTIIATVLRTGRQEWRATAHVLARLTRPRFSYARTRAEIAPQVEGIRNDGVLRARPAPSNDREIAEATGALIHHRSVTALIEAHDRHRQARQQQRADALQLLHQAGELAPVFGLAGTLVALSQLAATGLDRTGLLAAVGTAVLTTLYGLVTAHVLIYPVARLIERRGAHEESERDRLIEWLSEQVRDAIPGGSSQSRVRAA